MDGALASLDWRVHCELLWSALSTAAVQSIGQGLSLLSAAFNSQTYLAVEPLTTINAIGVGLMLFSLDQGLSNLPLDRDDEKTQRRRRLMMVTVDAMAWSGFMHLVSVIFVLLTRAACESICPTAGDNRLLSYATTLTLFSTAFTAGVVFRTWLRLMNLRDEPPPLAAGGAPSLRG